MREGEGHKRLDVAAHEALDELVGGDAVADRALDLAGGLVAGQNLLAVLGLQLLVDAELGALERRTHAADHRNAFRRRDRERNRHMVGIEIVVECRAAETREVLEPLHLAVGEEALAEDGIRKRRFGGSKEVLRERLVVPVVQVIALDHVAVVIRHFLFVLGEETVRHKSHAADLVLILFAGRVIEARALSAFRDVVVERTVQVADRALATEREVEVSHRDERGLRLEVELQGVLVGLPAELLHEGIPRVGAVARRLVRTALEEIRERGAADWRGRTRAVCRQTVDVEVVRDIQRAIAVAAGIEAERSPLARRRATGVVARLVHERRRDVGQALETERRDRVGHVRPGIGAHEHAVRPDVTVRTAATHRPDAGMRIVVDGTVDRIDRTGQGGLDQQAGRSGATQIARGQTRIAHVRGERDGRHEHESAHAEHDEKRAALSRGTDLH